MNRALPAILLLGLLALLVSCSGMSGSVGVYHSYPGYVPWWGGRSYFHDRTIVVLPDDIQPPLEETPLPDLPPDIPDVPDMGMPDIDLSGF